MTKPQGIYRHHQGCQLGSFHEQHFCSRPVLKDKHHNLRVCQHHKDLLDAIERDAFKLPMADPAFDSLQPVG